MSKKVIFLDVDGTFINSSGVIPESARRAVQETRKNGNYVFLCTGRSKAGLFDYIMKTGFDGFIASGGGYIEADGQTIFHKSFTIEDVRQLVSYFDSHGIDFFLESNGGVFVSKNCKAHVKKIFLEDPDITSEVKEEIKQGKNSYLQALIENENLFREDINKISFLHSDIPMDTIKDAFSGKFNVVANTVPCFGKNSGELSLYGIDKALSIQMLLDYLKLSREDTFAYGDGINDSEMLSFVKYGVAMGNAKEALKAIADDITDTPDENGIYNSFKKYGLI